MSTIASTTVSIAFSPVCEVAALSSSSVITWSTLPGHLCLFDRLVDVVPWPGEPVLRGQRPRQPGGHHDDADRDDRVVEVGPGDRPGRRQHEQDRDEHDPADRGPAD